MQSRQAWLSRLLSARHPPQAAPSDGQRDDGAGVGTLCAEGVVGKDGAEGDGAGATGLVGNGVGKQLT
jgi:hypothetical protein